MVPEPQDPTSTTSETSEARRLIAELFAPQTTPTAATSTSFRDETPNEPTGAAPVPQPDQRIVPAWAAGTAVAGIGVGAACVGIGCGIWLACQGFASVSLMSVLFVTLPIAALAAAVAAVGTAIRGIKAANAEHHHHYNGAVHQDHSSHSTKTNGLLASTKNDNRRR